MKETKISVFTLAVIAVVLAITILLPVAIHALFGNSRNVRNNAMSVLHHQNRVISPHFDWMSAGGWMGYFSGSLLIAPRRFTTRPPISSSVYVTTSIDFRWGRARLQDEAGNLGTEILSSPQSVFWNASRTTYWDNIIDDTHYIAWLGFDHPINRFDMVAMFPTLFVGNVYCCNDGIEFLDYFAIAWFALKTSDDPSDVLLGTHGNLARPNVNPHILDEGRLWEFESCFMESLQFLSQQQRTSDLIISSGIWGDIENIDFYERFRHFFSRKEYLGFVAHIRGYDLRNLYDTGVNLVRLIDDN